jgi:flagellar hook-associated protein 2
MASITSTGIGSGLDVANLVQQLGAAERRPTANESFDVVIDDDNNTLEGIRDAINDAVDNKGVSATIVNGDTGSFLILTGDNTGSDQSMIITQSGGDGGLSALEYDPPNSLNSLTETRQALDAQIKVDGYIITSDNNTVVDAMDGVTLNLIAANVGQTIEVTVANDLAAVRGQIDAFVNAYNNMISTFDSLTKFNKETETAAPLLGDSTVRTVRDRIRREMSIAVTDISATFDTLGELGIESDVDGKLELDISKLDDILATEFTKVGQLFASSDGFAVRLSAVVDGYLDEDVGLIKIRTDGLDTTIEDIADKRKTLNVRLERLEKNLLRQFNALDALVGQLSTTSNFLTIQLANLPKINAFKN